MEGEEDQKQFICRYCSKRFPCGKSLGGHLRSHRTSKDRAQMSSPPPPLDHSAASESAAYVLRENPKKTRRFADSRGGHPEWFCKECGKGFQSMKALCGHMACHSDKVLDTQSDTETTSGPRRGKRSKRPRYKTLDFNSNPSMFLSVANGSSSVSEIEQEQEEVAMCLMLLSRDCAYGKGQSSFVECSDNSSVVLEAKSSSIAENLNSGYKKFKSDGLESFDAELGKLARSKQQLKQIKADQSVSYGPIHGSSSKRRIKDHELWEICQKKIENGTASIDESWKIARKINGCYDPISESGENNIEAKRLGTKKSKGHECPICFREFKSGQALGGHKRSHFIGVPDDRTVLFVARHEVPRISGLLDLNLPAPDEEEDTPGSWQGRLGGSTSMTRQVGLR